MGFTNTNYQQTTASIIDGYKNRVNGATPYYKFSDKKPTEVVYWNLNTAASTLDCGALQAYDQLSDEAPLRYNRVLGFYIYGLGRIEPEINVNEYGPESSPIEGEAFILPNTLIPFEDDYFTIPYLLGDDKKILFRVTEVNKDTLDNGANWYRIHYVMDQTMDCKYDSLLKQTVKTFRYFPSLAGTNATAILAEETVNGINELSNIADLLRDFYINLFYKKNIQTFVYPYSHGCMLIYDPYLIEFIIRNKIFLTYDENYLYISQATFRSNTFAIEYYRTVFRTIEERNPELLLNTAWPIPICDPNSLLVDRMEEYLELSVQKQNYNFNEPINFYDMDLKDRIINNNPYDEEDQSLPHYRNIMINFMNGGTVDSITATQLESVKNIEYAKNKTLYYEIPFLMHVINTYISDMIGGGSSGSGDSDSDASKLGAYDKDNCLCNPCFALGK